METKLEFSGVGGMLKDTKMLLAHIRLNFAAAFYPRLSEWVAAGVTLFCGIVLVLNPDLMVESVRGYRRMLEYYSQPTWAMTFIVIGFTRLCILLVNGAIKKSPWLRAGGAFLSIGLWTQLVLSYSSVFGLGLSMALGFLVMDYLNVIRTMTDARAVDDHLRKIAGRGAP